MENSEKKRRINYLRFNNEQFESFVHDNFSQIELKEGFVNWINIPSVEHSGLIDEMGRKFGISNMVTEDIKNLDLLPKIENYKEYIFMILEDIEFDGEAGLQTKQLSLVLFKDLIISVEEDGDDLFEEVSSKIKNRLNYVESTADNIFFELVDMAVEDYFRVLEAIGERIDDVEDKLLMDPERDILNEVYLLKRDLISTRKTLWLMRNAINRLVKSEFGLIGGTTLNYLREIYDNIVQLVDLTETYRDICSGMLDIYLSSVSNRTNDIMKVLTILSTIFIPLTFLAGVYGMNFKHFPEIGWRHGYIWFWIISFIITAFMIRFFKKKKWI